MITKSQTTPWKVAGISRATYYRHLKKQKSVITEATYEAYLQKCIAGEGDIRVCAEIRNYLDKTEQLSKGKKEETAFDLKELMA